MKKLLFIVLLLTAGSLLFTGCKKSGESPSDVSESKLTGKWLYVKVVDVEDGDTDTETFSNGEYVTFNKDGSAFNSESNETAQWSLSGNKLSLNYGNETEVAEVKKITGSELVLFYQEGGYTSTIYFKR